MTLSATDNAQRRSNMVDGQLRPNKVSDRRVLAAMRALPRERFLPPALAALAYVDEDVALPGGRCLMEPMVLARLVQLADPVPDERVLVVGAGSGYGAAVLAACGAAVVALEENEDLLRLARATVPEVVADLQAPGVQIVSGPLAEGWPAGAPYDLVFVEGGFEQVPAAIAAQLRPQRIGQAVRRIGRDDERAMACRCEVSRGACGDRGLADAALAGVEDRPRPHR